MQKACAIVTVEIPSEWANSFVAVEISVMIMLGP